MANHGDGKSASSVAKKLNNNLKYTVEAVETQQELKTASATGAGQRCIVGP